MDRQSILERMGWIFTRIRSTEFFRNPERTLEPVLEKLHSLEIFPVDVKPRATRKTAASQSAPPQGSSLLSPSAQGLVDRVIARAEELLASWCGPQESGNMRRREPRQAMQKDYAAN